MHIIDQALSEDAWKEDITTNILIPKQHKSEAIIKVRQDAILCGLDLIRKIFLKIDKNIIIRSVFKDGKRIKKNTPIASLKGNTRAILTGERTALNFLAHLSGIATLTNLYVTKIKPYKAKILDTRKTTPGLRSLEKYAVRCGGGHNHRSNLKEMVLVKDNHLQFSDQNVSIEGIVSKYRKRTNKTIEIEVDNLKQFKTALLAKPDMILLDNMRPQRIKSALKILKNSKLKKRPCIEASGGITLNNVYNIAQTGVDQISIGALTHSFKSIDFTMEMTT